MDWVQHLIYKSKLKSVYIGDSGNTCDGLDLDTLMVEYNYTENLLITNGYR